MNIEYNIIEESPFYFSIKYNRKIEKRIFRINHLSDNFKLIKDLEFSSIIV